MVVPVADRPANGTCGNDRPLLRQDGRARSLHVLTLPDFGRVGAIQSPLGQSQDPRLGELLIDCEEDRIVRAVLVGMLREGDQNAR